MGIEEQTRSRRPSRAMAAWVGRGWSPMRRRTQGSVAGRRKRAREDRPPTVGTTSGENRGVTVAAAAAHLGVRHHPHPLRHHHHRHHREGPQQLLLSSRLLCCSHYWPSLAPPSPLSSPLPSLHLPYRTVSGLQMVGRQGRAQRGRWFAHLGKLGVRRRFGDTPGDAYKTAPRRVCGALCRHPTTTSAGGGAWQSECRGPTIAGRSLLLTPGDGAWPTAGQSRR